MRGRLGELDMIAAGSMESRRGGVITECENSR